MLDTALSILLAAFAVGLLILVHELGHFVVAKAIGARVEVFSIGYWKKLVAFRKGQTEYRISLIPFGGYIKLAGEMVGEGTGAPDEFCAKTPGQRALVFAAGAAMNAALGLVGFIVAFTIGVPFLVAEVGMLEKGWPAWQSGLREGDVIERINSVADPDFADVQREVALQGLESASVTVRRGSERLDFDLKLRYDPRQGIKRIGFAPPVEPVITGLFEVEADGRRCPAKEAGLQVGDRIVSIGGKRVTLAREIADVLAEHPHGEVALVVERDAKQLSFKVLTEPVPDYWIGISCVSATVSSLQAGAAADGIGLRAGDRIAAVNGTPVQSIVEVEEIIRGAYGPVTFALDRAGEPVTLRAMIADGLALDAFLGSLDCTASNQLTWVPPGTPAWKAGMRPGDRIVEVAAKTVESWEDIVLAGAGAAEEPRVIRWTRAGQTFVAEVTPVKNMQRRVGSLGCLLDRGRHRVRRLGVWPAVKIGFYKTYGAVGDILLTLRGFVRRDVSPRNLGGVVLIAYSSYRAAQQGIGALLYWTAIISVGLAFLNILPIPVLDGGHLLFVAIEKLRGRPLGERAMMISQVVGFSLLITLLAYVLRNDILRFLNVG